VDRRRDRRVTTDLSAAVFLRGSTRYVPSVLKNLSMSGAYLASQVPVGPGEHLVLSIRPPGSSAPMVAQARVVRIHGGGRQPQSGLGVVFTAMSRESYDVLANYWRQTRRAGV